MGLWCFQEGDPTHTHTHQLTQARTQWLPGTPAMKSQLKVRENER